jgi:hypothetical protein
MLAEAEGPQFHSAFDMTYGWEFHHIMNKIYKGEAKDLTTLKTICLQKMIHYILKMLTGCISSLTMMRIHGMEQNLKAWRCSYETFFAPQHLFQECLWFIQGRNLA